MKRCIILGYLLFCIFSVIAADKCIWFLFISILLFIPMKKKMSKLSYDELEEIFFVKFFRNKFPNHPLVR
jgi:hypothetical protein